MSASAKLVGERRCSDEEWQTRVDLAALYRLFVRYGWTDLIYTHISARVPGPKISTSSTRTVRCSTK